MKVFNCEQGSDEWLQLRTKCPTASELGSLITDAGKIRGISTEMPLTYMARKLAEKWLGGPLPTFNGGAAAQGTILEPEVFASIELSLSVDLEKVGFITTDDERFGCSPDAMGYEIKSPLPTNHIKWLLAEVCPPEHMLQVQGCMMVTGRDEWTFVSYRREFPKLVVVVEKDPNLCDVIRDAIDRFSEHFDDAWKMLCEKNGGPPKPRRVRATKPVDDTTMIGLETPEQLAAVGGPNFRSDL